MIRALLLTLGLLLMAHSPFTAVAQVDEMDDLTSGPVVAVESPAQVRFIVPDGPLQLGEPFPIRIQILLDGEYEAIALELDEEGQKALFMEPPRALRPTEFLLEAVPRRTGEHTFQAVVKAVPIGAEQPLTLGTPPLEISVAPPLLEASPEVRAYTATRALPFNYLARNIIIGVIVFVALVVVTLLGWLVWRYLKRKAAEIRVVPPVPPIRIALQEVAELSRLDYYRAKGSERHYTALSMALRRYIEGEYHVPAMEMTDEEMVRTLLTLLSRQPTTEPLTLIFQRSNLAKYARQPITEAIADEDCRAALEFLKREEMRIDAAKAAESARARNDSRKEAA
jgi:hypothetical protein